MAIIPETLYPGDLEVLETLAEGTEVELIRVPVDAATGLIDQVALQASDSSGGHASGGHCVSARQYFWPDRGRGCPD